MKPVYVLMALLMGCEPSAEKDPVDTDLEDTDTVDTDVVDTDVDDTDVVDTDVVDTDVDDTDVVETDVDDTDPVETDLPPPDRDGDGAPDAADCAPDDASVFPGAVEVCDPVGVDEDCDGLADDADPGVDLTGASSFFLDADGDGFGGADARAACRAPAGFAAVAGDCDDAAAAVNPAGQEICDAANVDEDCDGAVDDADPSVDTAGYTVFYPDLDLDGFGGDRERWVCDAPAGQVAITGDCNDLLPEVNPAAAEVCDAGSTDEDCDGLVDDLDASVDPGSQTAWWLDLDGDGHGAGASLAACDAPPQRAADAADCDDTNAAIGPQGQEVCDAANVDEDCDGAVDDADASVSPPTRTTWWQDADHDGFGGEVSTLACDAPDAHVARTGDCDDGAALVRPGGVEACDPANVDEDCDGLADDADDSVDGALKRPWWPDIDGDGAGAGAPRTTCDAPSGHVANDDDCDDLAAAIGPTMAEVCDPRGVDEDCDTLVNDADPSVDPFSRPLWYADTDDDGFGGGAPRAACAQPEGFITDASDCDDDNAAVSPLGVEICDAEDVDEDCDGVADNDEEDPASVPGSAAWYPDVDGDGYGDLQFPAFACDAPPRYLPGSGDCDDLNAAVSPDADEVCDPRNVDEDCDGAEDDNDPSVVGVVLVYLDVDGDGAGVGAPAWVCDPDAFAALVDGDCDDVDPNRYPGAGELCDPGDVDEDCDGLVDDADAQPVGASTWLVDGDLDGWGGLATVLACDLAPGRTLTPGDCDDADALVSPSAPEVCDPEDVDEDCDLLADDADPSVSERAVFYLDGDRDGFGGATVVEACDLAPGRAADTTDCDDGDAMVSPAGVETCDDRDEDCDGGIDDGLPRYYADLDLDGFGADAGEGVCLWSPELLSTRGDCDDSSNLIFPGAPETCAAADEDCDGLADAVDPDLLGDPWYPDLDGDGVGAGAAVLACAQPPDSSDRADDCDDADPETSPLAPELWGDEVDQDCDGDAGPPAATACTGVRIPGDYPTLSAMIGANGNVLRDVTICLGAGTFFGFPNATVGAVTIQGAGHDATTVDFRLGGGQNMSGTLTLRQLEHRGGFYGVGGTDVNLVLEDVRVRTTQATDTYRMQAGGRITLRRTEIDLTGTRGNPGVQVTCGNGSRGDLVIENSWLHSSTGTAVQVECTTPYFGTPSNSVTVRHALFSDVTTAMFVYTNLASRMDVDVRGSVFRDITGPAIDGLRETYVYVQDSVFEAVPTPYDRPNLSTVTEARVVVGAANLDDAFAPPRPTGPPLVDAGPVGVVDDFWGEARVGLPDIGPVER